ncbi:MAG: hypothetical protein FWC22_04560 [Treponema sp.]|nr:hypothetical protein [Treponema sp.]
MRKSLASRIIGLAALYCVVFCLLIILQFSSSGNFSLNAGAMSLRGRYLSERQSADLPENPHIEFLQNDVHWSGGYIAGGVKVFYGGLEFNLREERGKGLILTDTDGSSIPVNPEFMILTGSIARFILPGGTMLTFNALESSRGPELQITGEFADNIRDVTIPIIPRRSSLVQDSGQLGIMYSGSRYVFSTLGQELENGLMVLSKENAFMSYRSRGRQRAFDPADYIIAEEQNYDSILRNWQDTNYTHWNQGASSLQNEDDIIAYLAGSLVRGNYLTAVQNIPRNFTNSARQSFRSSVYVGGMTNAYRSFTSLENEKVNLITRLTRERSLDVLLEEDILNYLFVRSNINLANEVINIINNAAPDMLTADHCPGLLEAFNDVMRWRPAAGNLIDHLTEQMLILISDNLNRDVENDTVFASNHEGINIEYSARLGEALVYWAEATQNAEWAAIGRSLVLSAVSTGNAGRLHNIFMPSDYYPKAVLLSNEGLWAWTISQSVRASYADSNLTLSVNFPVSMTHHLIIRGVSPFLRVEIHNLNWRTDSQFERYDSSGWVYYSEEQILVLKLRHRTAVENVRIIYREAPPPPPPAPAAEDESPG